MSAPQHQQITGFDYSSLPKFLDYLGEDCLFLARHGETDWNALGIVQGRQDRPLNTKGVEQSKNLATLLRPVSLRRIFCSTLRRTIETALPISLEKNIPLERESKLVEAGLGIFEGQKKNFMSDKYLRKHWQAFTSDEVNIVPAGGGESLDMVDMRVRGLVETMLNAVNQTGHLLVVGHRNVNKMIIKNLLGLSLEDGYRVEQKNAWLYIFAPKRSEIFLVKIVAVDSLAQITPGYETMKSGAVK